jgi:hypothetical protein
MHGFDDLATVDALQIDGSDAEVAVAELALDNDQRNAFAGAWPARNPGTEQPSSPILAQCRGCLVAEAALISVAQRGRPERLPRREELDADLATGERAASRRRESYGVLRDAICGADCGIRVCPGRRPRETLRDAAVVRDDAEPDVRIATGDGDDIVTFAADLRLAKCIADCL